MFTNINFSVLDLAPVTDIGTEAEAIANSVAFAQHAEKLGYKRFWLAEHHNMDGIASAATAVLIRSEERRVGKERRSRRALSREKKRWHSNGRDAVARM